MNYENEPWYKMLAAGYGADFNMRNLASVGARNENQVLSYVMRSLDILEKTDAPNNIKSIVKIVLQWSEVARGGTPKQRDEWLQKGYDLHSHNVGSADIYREWNSRDFDKNIYHLIRRRATIGQIIQGEVPFDFARELHDDLSFKPADLRRVLMCLEQCVIGAVRPGLFDDVRESVVKIIDDIVKNKFPKIDYSNTDYIRGRIDLLHKSDDDTYLKSASTRKIFGKILSRGLWYFGAAMDDFTISEIVKIFQMIDAAPDFAKCKNISFAPVMNEIYRDHNEAKVVNLFKKRIMEQYLAHWTPTAPANRHIASLIRVENDTMLVGFEFSPAAQKLIEFCEIAYDDEIYAQAIFMLYDLFGFRRDDYDRFYNEEKYLATMDSGLSHKSVLLNYITGNTVLDVGPGGGSLMDLISQQMPNKTVCGIDLSENVIRTLARKKIDKNLPWDIIKGNALDLQKYIQPGTIDTIIYSSIIHELYSYIETDGKKFNITTVRNALESAYGVLPILGRIIIRDGVMTEPVNQYRIIEFKNPSDIKILERYAKDFKGRKISFKKLADGRVKMPINDAMEFLYTYTWGPDSYALEVKEQFGYLTPTGWREFINKNFAGRFEIIELRHFLQDGYEENLLPKIGFYNTDGTVAKLPDSTCILVIRKIK